MQDHTVFDLLVIGSGPGGYRAAVLGALRGLTVALVEGGEWGGCCLNRGCVPKKTWYHTARLMRAQRHFAERGVQGQLRADFNAAWEHQQGVVERIRNSYVQYLQQLKITAFHGHAEFFDPHRVRVQRGSTHEEIRAAHFIIATGSTPTMPAPFKLVPGKIINTDGLFNNPPPSGRRIALIGAGVVAVELAFILTQLGLEVLWLSRSIPLKKQPFSDSARALLNQALAEQGVGARQNAVIAQVHWDDGGVRLHLEDGTVESVDWVCLATGRQPYTRGLGLERTAIERDAQGFIQRNAYLQTAHPHIYAIGDVASPWMSANHALADARVALHNLLHPQQRQAADVRRIPLVVYSALEMACIGLNETQAEDLDYEPAVGFTAFSASPCALGQSAPEGFVRLLADLDTGRLLGGEIVGEQAGELIHLLSLAPDPNTALAYLAQGRYNHPARAEELLNATETLAHQWGLTPWIFGDQPR
ncbi:dihydrolipoyl dehydrogenase family protein [Thiorhodospira sibirica]|uniref:dihydrolipoyl dehydrogenase family protein n=1 Tax=Thiorhodospira sibirica TaxID=154347 RepID=UPI00022C22FE|nr:NAD(P)/FAD-dependent oxidoreductase [Thiorhodospira sibirica]